MPIEQDPQVHELAQAKKLLEDYLRRTKSWRTNRELSLAYTNVEQGKMWLDKALQKVARVS